MFRKKKKELSEAEIAKIDSTLATVKKIGTLTDFYLREREHQAYEKEKAEDAGKEYVDKTKLNINDTAVIAYRLIRDSRRKTANDGIKKDLLDKAIDVSQHVSDRKFEKELRAKRYEIDTDEILESILIFSMIALAFFFLYMFIQKII